MDIYIVQPGDTIFSIADKYKVPYQRLIYDNSLSPTYNIVPGQIILIAHPDVTYQVQNGDSIKSIAELYQITPLQLIQNNPFLLDRDYFNIGEELIISYPKKERPLEINAYVFSYITYDVLIKTLPYLTYLTIADYRLDEQGNILIPEDTNIIELAKEFGVAPFMMLSTFSEQGKGSFGITHKLLNNVDLQNSLIDNLIYTLREKGLSGINFSFQYVLPEDLQGYVDFIVNAYQKLQSEGYLVYVTLIPDTFMYNQTKRSPSTTYYGQIGQVVDAVVLLNYQFVNAYLSAVEQTTFPFIRNYTEYVLTQVPPEKIFLGYARIAYDWELPYVEGQSRVASLSNYDAIRLASDLGVSLGFDEYHMTPYYYYDRGGIHHYVWFKDARTLNAIIDIIVEYNLKGLSIWNAMDYTTQLWVTINSQYKISKVLNVTSEFL